VGTCDAPNGFVGSISGTCQGSGNWTVAGSCDALGELSYHLRSIISIRLLFMSGQTVALQK
jgi:hypothetical protein